MTPTAIAFAILLAANTQADSNRSDDYNDGFRAGYRQGFSEGRKEALREVNTRPPAPPPPPQVILGPIRNASAFYGSDSKQCNATHWVGRRADGRMSASVDVENSICGDPAPGQRKSLEIAYTCGSVAKTASAFEHRTAYLDCNS